ncbi:tyrosine-type recombinase/integrase [Arsenophonus nasoniae]|uniref:Tyrosine-type recombinase/integrase n=1 Tax=Arsenophonus nasoniae TaxID=638 RepID=A0AA95GBN1_9GAMM|nr:site-specific integrase [Arsenophonus nasoniae]WGL93767.1 tyrosine-type recombinase/integrase [Arsenophonus nasoniae]WGL96021.1 tyrosine-type recombinase/integrase [Arsenophonus nasoniae]
MAAENKLSEKRLKALSGSLREKQLLVADGRGLSVRVSKSGMVSFVFFYRLGDRKSSPIWLTLGKYPDMSLKQARRVRNQCREWLVENKDPRIYIKIEKETTLRPVTVKDALEYWIENYVKDKRKDWLKVQDNLKRYIYLHIGEIPLNECKASIWLSLFDKLKRKAPVISGATFLDVKQALRFCRVRRYAVNHELDDFTLSDMGKNAKKRDRVLTENELRDVWCLANKELNNTVIESQHRHILLLAILFGCRMIEIRKSTWDEWDFQNWIWTVPKENSKNGREIIRPIPKDIRQWLVNLKAVNNTNLILGKIYNQPSISTTMGRLWKKLGHTRSWCLHDMRRTLATNMADKGVNIYVIEQLLGHTLPGVMGIYNRSQYMSEKAQALEDWLRYLNTFIEADNQ